MTPTTASFSPTAAASSLMQEGSSEDKTMMTPDTVLFGSLAYNISDSLSDSIDKALMDGVSSLPKPKDNKLLEILRRTYFRNVDIFELYLGRNIFTLAQFTPTRRAAIVQAHLKKKNNNKDDHYNVKENQEHPNKNTSKTSVPPYEYPNKADIPSPEKLQALQDEVKGLRNALRNVRRRRNELVGKLNSLTRTDQAVKGAVVGISTTSNQEYGEKIAMLIHNKHGLEQVQGAAKELSDTLDHEKRSRPEDANEDDFVDLQAKTKRTLEETYQEQRSHLTNTEGIQKVVKLLK